jgi:membrane protease YdiL (CAAX protease family)
MNAKLRPWRLYAGLALVYGLFQALAAALGSQRGEGGLAVGAAVVAALLAVERLLFATTPAYAVRALGLGPPAWRGVLAAVAVGLLLLAVIPLYARATGGSVALQPGAAWALPGLFAQAGIAEEALFRGYLFRHLRAGRSFWRAASVAALPFVAVHLVLLLTMPPIIAVAAIVLAVAMSFPLAWLFELSGNTIWGPALLHFVTQGAIKVVAVDGAPATGLPLIWMAAAAALPFLVFVVPRRDVR